MAVASLAALRLAWVAGPLLCAALGQKLWRIAAHPAQLGLGEGLALLLPDLLFQAGLLCLGLCGLGLAARAGAATGFVALAQLAAAGYLLVAGIAHLFFLASGSVLDWSLFALGLAHPLDMGPAVSSQVAAGSLALVAGLPALVLVAPWCVRRGRRGAPAPVPAAWLAAGVPLALLCFGASLLPRVERIDAAFARDPVLHLALGAVRSGGAPAARPALARPSGPRAVTRASGATADRPHVAVVLLESTGAAVTTPWSGTPTTPFLAELAPQSLLVERAYAVVPHTSKAVVAALCGIEPRTSLAVVESERGGIPARCLAELLAEHGYRSAFFMSASRRYERFDRLAANLGFEVFRSGEDYDPSGFEAANYFGLEDAVLLEPSRRYLREHRGERLFVTYLTNTPHHDYRAPRRFGRLPLAEDDERNRYLNSVRYLDFFVRALFEQWRALGLYEDTVFVLLGDHGEAFGEHGLRLHDDVLYEEVLRVPFLLHRPADPRLTGRLPGPASHLDLAPTLLELLGFGFDPEAYPGRSLFAAPVGAERTLRAACYRHRQCLAAVRGPLKFISWFGMRPPELYDLTADPGETRNLAPGRAAEARALEAELLAWQRGVAQLHEATSRAPRADVVGREPPTPARLRPVRFGGYLELVGFDPPAGHPRSGFEITYYFRALAPVPPGHALLLRGRAGDREHVFEHVPARGLYPLEDWEPGVYVTDLHAFEIPRDWEAPGMALCLELRDVARGPVPALGAQVEGGCARLGELRFTDPPAR